MTMNEETQKEKQRGTILLLSQASVIKKKKTDERRVTGAERKGQAPS